MYSAQGALMCNNKTVEKYENFPMTMTTDQVPQTMQVPPVAMTTDQVPQTMQVPPVAMMSGYMTPSMGFEGDVSGDMVAPPSMSPIFESAPAPFMNPSQIERFYEEASFAQRHNV